VVASALVTSNKYFNSKNEIKISTKGGELKVVFEKLSDNNFKNIWLKGPAVKVFEGTFKI
jgi:diaminopimelate epimerase